MAAVQTPTQGNIPVKTTKSSKKNKKVYCILCRSRYSNYEAQHHLHSMVHHRELEAVLGKALDHKCLACKTCAMGLDEYAQHISSPMHMTMLKALVYKKVKPVPLEKSLNKETLTIILERNRKMKRMEKKAQKKKKKKEKQISGNKGAPIKKNTINKDLVQQTSKVENKVDNRTPLCPRNLTLQSQSQSLVSIPSDHPYFQQQFSQSLHPFTHCANSDTSTPSGQEGNSTETSRVFHTGEAAAADKTGHLANTVEDYYNYYSTNSSGSSVDFTSDHLPQRGAIIFESGQNENPQISETGQNGTKEKGNSAAPVDVRVMIRQIRRELGLREPCRADREARKQSTETQTTKMSDEITVENPGRVKRVGKVRVSRVSTVATSSPTTAQVSNTVRSVSTVTPRPKVSRKRSQLKARAAALPSTSSHMGRSKAAAASGSVSKTQTAAGQREARLNATLQSLLLMSGARGRGDWMEMYANMKRKSSERRGLPRFGIKLSKSTPEQQNSAPAQDTDLPLSEGFHWESVPDVFPTPHIPPPALNQPDTVSTTEEPPEPPRPAGAENHTGTARTEAAVFVKVEQVEEGNVEQNGNTRKRSHMSEEVSEKEPAVKKKKTQNTAKTQLDQLYTVSLKEEELNRRLQDLDRALVQAQNAIQAFMILREKYLAEVNNLRAQRIEILQGMKEGYSGASTTVENPSTSSAASPSAAPASSSNPVPFTSQLHPALIKQEMYPALLNVPHNINPPLVPLSQPLLPPDLLLSQTLLSARSSPAVVLSNQFQPENAVSLNALPPVLPPNETVAVVKKETPLVQSVSEPREAEPREGSKNTASVPHKEDGNESDASLEVMEPQNQVINLDESENEESSERVSSGRVHREPTAVSARPVEQEPTEYSSAETQTSQQTETKSKVQPVALAKHETSALQVSADSVDEDEPSVGAFQNHNGPVTGLQIYEGLLFTCSGDNTARAYDLQTKECVAVFEGHLNKINCLLVSSLLNMPPKLYTGSSDQTIRCFSIKTKKCLQQISVPDRVLCLHVAWNILYAGLANGAVASFDLKTLKELDVFECHGPRGISCLATAQEGARRVLLVGSYDSTISVRDTKSGLLLRSLEGHSKTVLCLKVVNDLVFSGSSDTSVRAHNIHTGELVQIYKGHGHAVTSIVILGKVMVTACLDKLVRVYELQSHDRLQVYGGHSDMVMCMAIHKSVMYTGCYDGTVQAVKLNLIKNFRCWWQNCSLIFGMAEHLAQHLVKDHTNPNLQTVKCRWRDCSSFFSTQISVRQELPEHMKRHVETDSKIQA